MQSSLQVSYILKFHERNQTKPNQTKPNQYLRIMSNTLVVAGDIKGYGATHDEDLFVVPVAMLDRNSHPPTGSSKQ